MAVNHEEQNINQLSFFDIFADISNKNIDDMSSEDWLKVITIASEYHQAKVFEEEAEKARLEEEKEKR